MLLADASTETSASVTPPTIPRLNELALDWRVMTFAIVISMRTQEIGGAQALGAERPHVLRKIIRQGIGPRDARPVSIRWSR